MSDTSARDRLPAPPSAQLRAPADAPPPIRLVVVRHRDGWRIAGEASGGWGRFRYRVDAEEAALRLARRLAEQGATVELMAEDLKGGVDLLSRAS